MAARAVAGIKTTIAFPMVVVKTNMVGVMLTTELCLYIIDSKPVRLLLVAVCLSILPIMLEFIFRPPCSANDVFRPTPFPTAGRQAHETQKPARV